MSTIQKYLYQQMLTHEKRRVAEMRSTNNDSYMTHHRAFTLIELLVVIAIIGVLIGLLLPAVQQVRESARMLSCKNNLKQIGLALHNYHDANRSFPPFFTSSGGNDTRIADQTGKSANWCVLILPYMEQSVIYDQWDFDLPPHQNPQRSEQITAFLCPSDSSSSGELCAYAGGNWARGNYGMNVSPCHHGIQDNQSDGGFGAINSSIRIRDFRDGTSNTVAINELRAGLNKHDLRGCWAMPGLGSGTAAMYNDASRPNSRQPYSDDMENCAVSGSLGTPPMGCYDSQSTGQMTARSQHPGGTQFLMADASTRYVTQDIDFKGGQNNCGPAAERGIWQKIHTRNSGEVVGEF